MASNATADAPEGSASDASSGEADASTVAVPDCLNCTHNATTIAWSEKYGSTAYCMLCRGAYNLPRAHDHDDEDEVGHHFDLDKTESIAGFCVECGPDTAAKTSEVTDDRDAVIITCDGCDTEAVIDPGTAANLTEVTHG